MDTFNQLSYYRYISQPVWFSIRTILFQITSKLQFLVLLDKYTVFSFVFEHVQWSDLSLSLNTIVRFIQGYTLFSDMMLYVADFTIEELLRQCYMKLSTQISQTTDSSYTRYTNTQFCIQEQPLIFIVKQVAGKEQADFFVKTS